MREGQFIAILAAFASVAVPLVLMGIKFGHLSQKVSDLCETVKKIDDLGGLTQRSEDLQKQVDALFGRTKENAEKIHDLQRQVDKLG